MLRICRPARALGQIRSPWIPARAAIHVAPGTAAGRKNTIITPSMTTATRRTFATVRWTQDPTERDAITTLSNGIRVASEDLPDAFSGVGIYIDAGSRYENDSLRGVSHIMDRLAFKSTTDRTADEMLEIVENLGGNIQCASSRESMMYQAATFNAAIPQTMGLLADTIRNPNLTDEEIEQQLETAKYEVTEIWSKPELILPELVHTAAFKDNTLGNPLLCPEDRLEVIDRSYIRAYRQAFYRPERIVVAFAGVAHAEAVRLTEKFFGDMTAWETPAISRTGSETSLDSLQSDSSDSSATGSSSSTTSPLVQQPSRLISKIPFLKHLSTSAPHNASVITPETFSRSTHSLVPILSEDLQRPSQYTGGFLSLPALPLPLNPNQPTFTHIQLAFEGLPISSDDIYALATLQTLLGGGGSFSAGGPGKGMYSRLYTNVLNQHGWVESCMAFNHSYTDSGLFGIAASCYPGRTLAMLQVMCRELQALTHEGGFSALNEIEVARAKNQLRSSLLMNLESRMVELEDLGRQVQVHGHKIPVREMTARINDLTVEDLRRVAKMVVSGMVQNRGAGSGAPTVVLQEATAQGVKQTTLPWDQIQDVISQWNLGRR
ncbi:mitochondrial processing peptidase alpha subunit-like protein [Lasiosphaeria miniovina]|uniref:Mitochondrial-processing peptidase subunit alpha n=1 Tax=Lasiosphaeria miniovina TaxID=1954250 RepID=A0AA40AUY2_9PEZI|nr:mitochondrial processing peptidase alpha subunit-like protein [Lasiosphaeria miniovina]KAK0722442.1 mitochondrial processing peptidase alpha subunit-like protein [Lasiosphaeria miniovina]